jgi:hypothetical protein
MGVHSKGIVVIRIERGDLGQWNVLESDFEDPLATFDDRQRACDYANKLSASKSESTVVLLDEAANARTDRPDLTRSHSPH